MDKYQALREKFPATRDGVFLDIAYDNSGSDLAVDAVTRYIRDLSIITPDQKKAAGAGRGKGREVVIETRKLVADFLGGVDPECISFTKNTNEGILNVLHGYPFQPGDNIVTSNIEHPSVIMPCLAMKDRGVECRVLQCQHDFGITSEELMAATDENTRFIICSHVQSATGYKLDLEKLCTMAHEKGIYVLVDAIQALGFTVLDAKKWQPDLVAAAGYKGLLAIDGIGIMYTAHGLLEKIRPVYAAANADLGINKETWELDLHNNESAIKFENSSMNIAGIYALNAGISALMDIGMENVDAHTGALFHRMYDGLVALGFTPTTPRDRNHSAHSVSTIFPDKAEAYKCFMENGVHLSSSGGKFIRASIAPFTNEADIDRFLEVAAIYKKSLA